MLFFLYHFPSFVILASPSISANFKEPTFVSIDNPGRDKHIDSIIETSSDIFDDQLHVNTFKLVALVFVFKGLE